MNVSMTVSVSSVRFRMSALATAFADSGRGRGRPPRETARVNCVPSGYARTALGDASVLHAKNNVHDMLHIPEMLRVEVVGDLDVFVVCPGDLEDEACGCELKKSQAEVTSVGTLIVALDVRDAAVFVLELTLNDKIWVNRPRQIKVIVAGSLAFE